MAKQSSNVEMYGSGTLTKPHSSNSSGAVGFLGRFRQSGVFGRRPFARPKVSGVNGIVLGLHDCCWKRTILSLAEVSINSAFHSSASLRPSVDGTTLPPCCRSTLFPTITIGILNDSYAYKDTGNSSLTSHRPRCPQFCRRWSAVFRS